MFRKFAVSKNNRVGEKGRTNVLVKKEGRKEGRKEGGERKKERKKERKTMSVLAHSLNNLVKEAFQFAYDLFLITQTLTSPYISDLLERLRRRRR